jgi:hypothetical protein
MHEAGLRILPLPIIAARRQIFSILCIVLRSLLVPSSMFQGCLRASAGVEPNIDRRFQDFNISNLSALILANFFATSDLPRTCTSKKEHFQPLLGLFIPSQIPGSLCTAPRTKAEPFMSNFSTTPGPKLKFSQIARRSLLTKENEVKKFALEDDPGPSQVRPFISFPESCELTCTSFRRDARIFPPGRESPLCH